MDRNSKKTGLNKDKIYFHYLGDDFKKVFGQGKKKSTKGYKLTGPGWFQPVTSITRNKKTIKIDNIKTVIKCFIPEEKYGRLLVKQKLVDLGYETNYDAEADYFIKELGLIFEFDGNHHYMEPFKYLRDERKKESLKSIKLNGKNTKINIIRIPYYYGFTNDVAKYIFKTLINHFKIKAGNTKLPKDSEGFYSNDKYLKAISKIHYNMFTGKPATSDLEVPACGIHESEFGPAGYCSKGIEKLLDDFKKEGELAPPKSIEHQYMWCLKYWLDDITEVNADKRKWLILPLWHKEFMVRYNDNIKNRKEEYLKNVFGRDYDSILRTKK